MCREFFTNSGKAKKSEGKIPQQHVSVTEKNRFVRLVVFQSVMHLPC